MRQQGITPLQGKSTLVFIPTYNEAENIAGLIGEIARQLPGCEILIVDDNSPDGTAAKVSSLQKTAPFKESLKLIGRAGKMGLGSAHRLAMHYAISGGYGYLITMDGDSSHDPAALPVFMEKLQNSDFVIGSRFLPGSRNDYTGLRRILSCGANWLLRNLTGMKCTEFTTAYRGFRVSWIAAFPFHQIRSDGYSFMFQLLYWVHRFGARCEETPIHFRNRHKGKSKINGSEIFKAAWNVSRISWMPWLRRKLPVSAAGLQGACEYCGSSFLEGGACLVCGQEKTILKDHHP